MKGSWQNQICAQKKKKRKKESTVDSLSLDYLNKISPKITKNVFKIMMIIKIQTSILLSLLN